MAADEVFVAGKILIVKIYAITGWTIPSNDIQDIFIEQLYHKMMEAYLNLTISEFEYAFRNYGTTVKDWGKQINLSLIDEVISAYLKDRFKVSKIEQSLIKELPPAKESLSDQSMQDWLNSLRTEKRIEFMPVMLYDWAANKGLFNYSTQEKKEFYKKAINKKFNDLLEASQDFSKSEYQVQENKQKLAAFTQMKLNNKFSDEEKNCLISIAKKIALFEYLKNTA